MKIPASIRYHDLAKAMGNGFPVGAMLTTDKIATAFQPEPRFNLWRHPFGHGCLHRSFRSHPDGSDS